MENKRQKVVRYISGSRAEFQHPPMESRQLDQAIEQWLIRLRWIPDDQLDECYQVAMDNHSTRSVLIPKEMLDAWNVIRQRPGYSLKPEQREKLCKWGCSEGGWITVDAAGTAFVELCDEEKYNTRKEYLYVKACPEHRPAGIPQVKYAAPHCSGDWPRTRTRPGAEKIQEHKATRVTGWKTLGEVAETVIPTFDEPEPLGPVDDFLGW